VEEVAYTWFNRFIALRYMEVHDYLPIGIRIISSEIPGKMEPDILFRVGEVIRELRLDSDLVYKLLDSSKNSDRENLYKYILIRQCNELGNIIPGLFEKIEDLGCYVFEEFKKDIFQGLESFGKGDGLHFNMSVIYAFGEK